MIRQLARAAFKTVRPTARVSLEGHIVRVPFEARHSGEDRDFPVIRALARDADLVYDVGAHMGLTSLTVLPQLSTFGRVVAFEASESSCAVIKIDPRA